ncbi:NAC transcription factor 29-like [Papaver somniferum]|uniref:NAC transcription factor 29-like n=1 Tax=Papaver somniferum TaxID=3469 RepID=UPI000E704136|nr:NAC transcription factor 29-like [Papaver somniferum]
MRNIKKDVKEFVSILNALYWQTKSGENHEDLDQHNQPFKYDACYELFRAKVPGYNYELTVSQNSELWDNHRNFVAVEDDTSMFSSSSSSVETTLSSTKPMLNSLADEATLASLPSGFRFQPNDEILIDYYLARKNMGEALPANRMKEVLDFYDHHPKKLTQDYKGYESSDWYLFTRKYTGEEAVGGSLDNPNGVRIRAAGEGCWMSKTGGSFIYSTNDSTIIGCKDTWAYHEVQGSEEHKTEYVMTEFMTSGWEENSEEENDEWVLCAIFKN